MDGFTYYNIFDTKGMEYLAIIAFLALLIPFWIMLNKEVPMQQQIRQALGALTAKILRIPRGLYHSPNHTWTHLERSGIARIGLDDLLVHITGEMRFRNLKQPGEMVRKGELVAEFEQEGKQLRIYSPVSGNITAVNQKLSENPGLLTGDPYGKGWLFQLSPTDWKAETASYYVADETTGWVEQELDRFKDFMAGHRNGDPVNGSMVVLQDGGELMNHTLSGMPGELWQNFQKEFLDPAPPRKL